MHVPLVPKLPTYSTSMHILKLITLLQVVVEQYAPVSSARDRFNKADDKPLTPRNSWGGCVSQ